MAFCLGDGEIFSATGIAVIERPAIEAPEATLHVVHVAHEDIAWDLVLRHLRTFTGKVLLVAFSNSEVYDAGVAKINYSKQIRQFDPEGELFRRLTESDRKQVRQQMADILKQRSPPNFYPAGHHKQEDAPWIFSLTTPAGKALRTAVWNGRRDFAHELPSDIIRWVGGDRIAVVQVADPVGVNLRSSLDLTHKLAKDFDGVVHRAKDCETFQSILASFIRLDLESVSAPELPDGWDPEVVIYGSNA